MVLAIVTTPVTVKSNSCKAIVTTLMGQ